MRKWKTLRPHTGKGKGINDYLRKELGIPDSSKWYEIRVCLNEPITIKCEYFANEMAGEVNVTDVSDVAVRVEK